MDRCANHPLQRYYRWHARLYDATRWTFLFGRQRLVRLAAAELGRQGRLGAPVVVEVGCGTGHNLRALAKALPAARLTGIDLCESMLARARRSMARRDACVRLSCAAYGRDSLPGASVDLVVFSYALSMFNPGYEAALDAAAYHMRPGGLVAVVDFHDSPAGWFQRWMGINHVRMDGHLPPVLDTRFAPVRGERQNAYAGLWSYFHYIGRKA